MKCIKCECDIQIVSKKVTVELKGRKVAYTQKSSNCSGCGFAFFTPKQLDENSVARKKSYDETKKSTTYK